jgi:hypothetical protein
MKRFLLLTAFSVLLLAGCAVKFKLPDPTLPRVVVSPAGYLVVNQEPIVILLSQAKEDPVITWRLPESAGQQFDERDGIQIIGRVKTGGRQPERLPAPDTKQNDLFRCARDAKDAFVFRCTLSRQLQPGQYAYAIRTSGQSGRIVLDPTIMIL